MPPVPIYGEPDGLVGQLVEELRSQSFVSNGELVSSANAIFIKASGPWYRVALDAGTVHWTKQDNEPLSWEVPENGWSYPHRDIGYELGLVGAKLLSLRTSQEGEAIRVELTFSNGKRLLLVNHNDSSSYHVA